MLTRSRMRSDGDSRSPQLWHQAVVRSFNGETKIFRKLDGLPSNFVQCLYLDHNGVLWVGTAGGGLARIKEGKCVPIGQAQGLRDMHICAIAEDTFGFLWASSLGGVMRLKKTELEACADGLKPTIDCLPLGTSDGMPTLQCSGGLQSASCASADGKLWFATRKGLISIDPRASN